jgi:photosystem II stability/assembly factor-like uncharacterized protein
LAIDPKAPGTLYAGTGSGLFTSTDGGKTWTLAAAALNDKTVDAVAIAAGDPHTVYAAANTWVPGKQYAGGVFRSSDGGKTWDAAGAGLPESRIRALAIHPQEPKTVYAGTEAGVFKSTDGGSTWSAENTGLKTTNVQALAIAPSTGKLYAGTSGGGLFGLSVGP